MIPERILDEVWTDPGVGETEDQSFYHVHFVDKVEEQHHGRYQAACPEEEEGIIDTNLSLYSEPDVETAGYTN